MPPLLDKEGLTLEAVYKRDHAELSWRAGLASPPMMAQWDWGCAPRLSGLLTWNGYPRLAPFC